jgi:hypothetical protein
MKFGAMSLLLLALLLVSSYPAQAAGGMVTVDAPLPVQATLNGTPFLITGPVSVSGILCMQTLVYVDSFDRFSFAGWFMNGTSVGSSACYTVTTGAILAHYNKQFLVTIIYSPQNRVANSTWVNAGSSVRVSLPATLDDPAYRYVLEQVLVQGMPVYAPGGSTSVSADAPVTVEGLYKQFVNVTIVYPSNTETKWLPAGQDWFYTFPRSFPEGKNSSLRFDGVNVFGTNQYTLTGNVLLLSPTSPLILEPLYHLYYYVVVSYPSGVLERGWYRSDSLLNATVPQEILINDQEKVVFAGWIGASGTNQLSIPVNQSMSIRANYVTQYQVSQVSPLGTSSRFVNSGATTSFYFPPTLTASLGFTRFLKGVTVNGVDVPNQGGTVVVTVSGPTLVSASYDYEPDFIFIGLLVLAAAAVLVAYIATSRRRRSTPPT